MYSLTAWSRVLLKNLTSLQLIRKFFEILRNPNVHYRIHKNPPTFSILCQSNPLEVSLSHMLHINSNIIHPSTPRSSELSPLLRCPHQNPVSTTPVPPYMPHAPPISFFLSSITRMIFGKEYFAYRYAVGSIVYRVSQEEWTKLRESVPYVEL